MDKNDPECIILSSDDESKDEKKPSKRYETRKNSASRNIVGKTIRTAEIKRTTTPSSSVAVTKINRNYTPYNQVNAQKWKIPNQLQRLPIGQNMQNLRNTNSGHMKTNSVLQQMPTQVSAVNLQGLSTTKYNKVMTKLPEVTSKNYSHVANQQTASCSVGIKTSLTNSAIQNHAIKIPSNYILSNSRPLFTSTPINNNISLQSLTSKKKGDIIKKTGNEQMSAISVPSICRTNSITSVNKNSPSSVINELQKKGIIVTNIEKSYGNKNCTISSDRKPKNVAIDRIKQQFSASEISVITVDDDDDPTTDVSSQSAGRGVKRKLSTGGPIQNCSKIAKSSVDCPKVIPISKSVGQNLSSVRNTSKFNAANLQSNKVAQNSTKLSNSFSSNNSFQNTHLGKSFASSDAASRVVSASRDKQCIENTDKNLSNKTKNVISSSNSNISALFPKLASNSVSIKVVNSCDSKQRSKNEQTSILLPATDKKKIRRISGSSVENNKFNNPPKASLNSAKSGIGKMDKNPLLNKQITDKSSSTSRTMNSDSSSLIYETLKTIIPLNVQNKLTITANDLSSTNLVSKGNTPSVKSNTKVKKNEIKSFSNSSPSSLSKGNKRELDKKLDENYFKPVVLVHKLDFDSVYFKISKRTNLQNVKPNSNHNVLEITIDDFENSEMPFPKNRKSKVPVTKRQQHKNNVIGGKQLNMLSFLNKQPETRVKKSFIDDKLLESVVNNAIVSCEENVPSSLEKSVVSQTLNSSCSDTISNKLEICDVQNVQGSLCSTSIGKELNKKEAYNDKLLESIDNVIENCEENVPSKLENPVISQALNSLCSTDVKNSNKQEEFEVQNAESSLCLTNINEKLNKEEACDNKLLESVVNVIKTCEENVPSELQKPVISEILNSSLCSTDVNNSNKQELFEIQNVHTSLCLTNFSNKPNEKEAYNVENALSISLNSNDVNNKSNETELYDKKKSSSYLCSTEFDDRLNKKVGDIQNVDLHSVLNEICICVSKLVEFDSGFENEEYLKRLSHSCQDICVHPELLPCKDQCAEKIIPNNFNYFTPSDELSIISQVLENILYSIAVNCPNHLIDLNKDLTNNTSIFKFYKSLHQFADKNVSDLSSKKAFPEKYEPSGFDKIVDNIDAEILSAVEYLIKKSECVQSVHVKSSIYNAVMPYSVLENNAECNSKIETNHLWNKADSCKVEQNSNSNAVSTNKDSVNSLETDNFSVSALEPKNFSVDTMPVDESISNDNNVLCTREHLVTPTKELCQISMVQGICPDIEMQDVSLSDESSQETYLLFHKKSPKQITSPKLSLKRRRVQIDSDDDDDDDDKRKTEKGFALSDDSSYTLTNLHISSSCSKTLEFVGSRKAPSDDSSHIETNLHINSSSPKSLKFETNNKQKFMEVLKKTRNLMKFSTKSQKDQIMFNMLQSLNNSSQIYVNSQEFAQLLDTSWSKMTAQSVDVFTCLAEVRAELKKNKKKQKSVPLDDDKRRGTSNSKNVRIKNGVFSQVSLSDCPSENSILDANGTSQLSCASSKDNCLNFTFNENLSNAGTSSKVNKSEVDMKCDSSVNSFHKTRIRMDISVTANEVENSCDISSDFFSRNPTISVKESESENSSSNLPPDFISRKRYFDSFAAGNENKELISTSNIILSESGNTEVSSERGCIENRNSVGCSTVIADVCSQNIADIPVNENNKDALNVSRNYIHCEDLNEVKDKTEKVLYSHPSNADLNISENIVKSLNEKNEVYEVIDISDTDMDCENKFVDKDFLPSFAVPSMGLKSDFGVPVEIEKRCDNEKRKFEPIPSTSSAKDDELLQDFDVPMEIEERCDNEKKKIEPVPSTSFANDDELLQNFDVSMENEKRCDNEKKNFESIPSTSSTHDDELLQDPYFMKAKSSVNITQKDVDEALSGFQEKQNASKSDSRRKRQIEKLEKQLGVFDKKIKKLEEKELSMDDLDKDYSVYVTIDLYKRRFVKCWELLCKLKKVSSRTGRAVEKKFNYQGSRHPAINEAISKLINKRKPTEKFPNYADVFKIVIQVNETHDLDMPQQILDIEARRVFQDVGRELQRRRTRDFEELFGCHLTDKYKQDEDPAENDEHLKKLLQASAHRLETSINSVIEKYAEKQVEINEKSDEENTSPVENDDGDSNDDLPSTAPTSPAKANLKTSKQINKKDLVGIDSDSDVSTDAIEGKEESSSFIKRVRKELTVLKHSVASSANNSAIIADEIEVVDDDIDDELPSLQEILKSSS